MTDTSNALEEMDLPRAWRQACERPDTIRVNGREYVWVQVAAKRLYVDPQTLNGWARDGVIPAVVVSKRRYVHVGTVRQEIERRFGKKTDRIKVLEWMGAHPGEWEHLTVQAALGRLAKDGIHVGHQTVYKAMQARGVNPKLNKARYRILAWLEADPERRYLPRYEMRRQIERHLKRTLCAGTVTHAVQLYDAKHGSPYPQGDEWLNVEQAAAYLGLNPDTIREMRRRGELPMARRGPGRKRVRWHFHRDGLDQVRLIWQAQPSGQKKARRWLEAHPESRLTARQIGALLGVSIDMVYHARRELRREAHGAA